MAKYLFTLLSFCMALSGYCQQKEKTFSLSGTIQGQEVGMIYLNYSGAGGKPKRDSAAIKNGSFFFKGALDHPVIANISGRIKSRSMDDPNFTTFFIEPVNIKMKVKADAFKDAVFTGSKIQNAYASLAKAKAVVQRKYQLQLDSLRSERDAEKNAAIRDRLQPYFAEMDVQDYLFFKKYPQSYVTAYMLRFHVSDLTLDSLQFYYDGLGKSLQQTVYGKDIASEIKNLIAGSPGSYAKNFTAPDINGNQLTLSDYKGKFVLLDFWASWCVPCRKGNPHLIDLYTKYKEQGIEFIGIADDDRAEDAWKKAVEKDGIQMWKHVRRGLKFSNGNYDRSNDISEKFGIHTLPTKILIDKNGMIIGRYGEDEKQLDEKLRQIFATKKLSD